MNFLYDVTKEDDVYARHTYYYLLNKQRLRTQLQVLKDEELAFAGFRRLFEMAERNYEERCRWTQLLNKNFDDPDDTTFDLQNFTINFLTDLL